MPVAFSAKLAEAAEVMLGASFWLVTAMLMTSLWLRPPASVTATVMSCAVALS